MLFRHFLFDFIAYTISISDKAALYSEKLIQPEVKT